MKASNVLIAVMVVILGYGILSYVRFIKDNLQEKSVLGRQIWLKGNGAYFEEEIIQSYTYLHSDFPIIELDPKKDAYIRIEGYENAKEFVETHVISDTLHIIYKKVKEDTIIVPIEGEYPLKVTVGSKALKEIILLNEGRIDHPVKPFGSDEQGQAVYDQVQWEAYVLRNPSLVVTLIDGGSARFLMEVDSLRVQINNENRTFGRTSSFRSPELVVSGKGKKMTIDNPYGPVYVNTTEFLVDQVFIRSLRDQQRLATGSIHLNCTKGLYAILEQNLDVYYIGEPEIIKKETNYGRVMNLNVP